MFRSKTAATGHGSSGKGATLIASNATVTGDIEFADELIVSGTVKGNVSTRPGVEAQLVVTQSGVIEGEIHVPTAAISGNISGDIHVAGVLKLATGACVSGNVYYDEIEMARGASIQGSMVHAGPDADAPAQNAPEAPKSDPKRAKQAAAAADAKPAVHRGNGGAVAGGDMPAAPQPAK